MLIETTLKRPTKKYEKGSGPCEIKAFKIVTRLDLSSKYVYNAIYYQVL